MIDEDELLHANEGLWYRFRCGKCNTMNEVESDPRGEIVECEACGHKAKVEGDY